MDLTFITQHYILSCFSGRLVVGYCIKHIKWLEAVSNQYIPSILAILGQSWAVWPSGSKPGKYRVRGRNGLASKYRPAPGFQPDN